MLEPDDGKLSSPVLRGRANCSRISVKLLKSIV